MKMMQEITNPLQTSGLGATEEFKIASSTLAKAKAFKILAAGYAHKIRAVIREYGTNCLDAHRLNDQTRPFEVTLPSQLHPHLSIRDFGPGLSKEDFTGLYTTLFESTKTSSNAYNGAMGLGSKSGFSYTDQFTGISRHDGIKTTYAIYLNEHRIPVVSEIMSETSDEPSGLEIIIPVRPNDVQSFINEAAYVYYWFEKKPLIKNCPNFKYIEPAFERETDSYILSSAYNGVLMSDVFYPIDKAALSDEIKELGELGPYNIILKMENGSCDFTPTREALSFDPVTYRNVLAAFKAAIADIEQVGRWFTENATAYQIQRFEHGSEVDFGNEIRRDMPSTAYINIKMKYAKRRLDHRHNHMFALAMNSSRTSVTKISANGDFIRVIRKRAEALEFTYNTQIIYVGRNAFELEQARRHMKANGTVQAVFVIDDYWRTVMERYPTVIFCWELPPQPSRKVADPASPKVEKPPISFWTFAPSVVRRNHIGMKHYVRMTLADLELSGIRHPLVPCSRGMIHDDFYMDYAMLRKICSYRTNSVVVTVSPNYYAEALKKYAHLFYDPREEVNAILNHPERKNMLRIAAYRDSSVTRAFDKARNDIRTFEAQGNHLDQLEEYEKKMTDLTNAVYQSQDAALAYDLISSNRHSSAAEKFGWQFARKLELYYAKYASRVLRDFKATLNELELAYFENSYDVPARIAEIILKMRKERLAA